ncbi:hypothetical protein D3C86_1623280 [compost metagenome]
MYKKKGDAPETSHAPDLWLFAFPQIARRDECVPGSVPLRDDSCCIPFTLVEMISFIKRTCRFEQLFSFVQDIHMNHARKDPDQ